MGLGVVSTHRRYSVSSGEHIRNSTSDLTDKRKRTMDETSLSRLGREAYRNGNFDLAASYYRKSLELQPDDYDLVNRLGSVLILQSKYAAAAQVYSDAITRLEKEKAGEVLGNMHISLAEVYMSQHRQEEAEAQIELAGKSGANLAALCEVRGRRYNAIGEYDKALFEYEEYNRFAPTENHGYLGMATAYECLEQYDLATQSLNSAKALTPDDYWVAIAFGNLAMTLKDYDCALSHYQLAREMNPKKPATIFSIGRAYLMMKDYANAKKMFSLALELRPNDTGSLYGFAQIEIIEGNARQAIALLKSAVLIDPSNHEYYALLIQTQVNSGKWLDAVRTALKSRKLALNQAHNIGQ